MSRDWTEDSHLENGNYQNRCIRCEQLFLGYKRRPICKSCHNQNKPIMDITDIIKGKVKLIPGGSGDVWDEDNNHIADARGWGRFQYEGEEGVKKHDFLTQFIVDAINEKLQRLNKPIIINQRLGKAQQLIEQLAAHDIKGTVLIIQNEDKGATYPTEPDTEGGLPNLPPLPIDSWPFKKYKDDIQYI